MSDGTFQLSIGLQDAGFKSGMDGVLAAYDAVRNKTAALASGLAEGDRALLSAGEKTDLLQHALKSCGGEIAGLADLVPMAMNPLTAGFAAAFGAIELFNSEMEKSRKLCENFEAATDKIGDALKKVAEAKPTQAEHEEASWEMEAKASEHPQDFKTFDDNFSKNLQASQQAGAEAAEPAVNNQIKYIENLKQGGRISAEEADLQNATKAKARDEESAGKANDLDVRLAAVKNRQQRMLPGQQQAIDLEAKAETATAKNTTPEANSYKPEHLSLEKMGFVMGGNSSLEYNRRTAVAVEQIAAFCNRTGAVTPTNSGNQANLT